MFLWLAIAAALLLAPIAGVFPPMREGRAFNAILHIAMPKPPTYAERWIGRLAQEVVEWWAAWFVAVLLSAPAAWALSAFLPFGWAFAPLTLPIAWCWRKSDWGTRQIEYIGWPAEWLTLRRRGLTTETFAEYVSRASYIVFAGMTGAEIAAHMRRRLPIARVLIALLTLRINRGVPK